LAVLASLLLYGVLRPSEQSFDALALLITARHGSLDLGHALFVPLLRISAWSNGGTLNVASASWTAAVGGALAFALLARRLVQSGATIPLAWATAGTFACSTLVWQEAGSIEPTSWTVVVLLIAARTADAYGARPSFPRLAACSGALLLALGFHVVSVCALPWLVWLARRSSARIPRAHWAALVAFACLLVALVILEREQIEPAWSYWRGFIPDYSSGLAVELGGHLARGGRLLVLGAPVLIALGLRALWRLRAQPARSLSALLLVGPYGLAFLVFGRPLVGLLMPVILGLALLCAHACVARPARRETTCVIVACGLQLMLTLPQALEWSFARDAAKERAERLARVVPAGTVLFAGALANHYRFYCPHLEVVSLPELWHRAHARGETDPIAVVERVLGELTSPCALSTDGAGFLQGSLGADVRRLGLSLGRALFAPEDSALAIFPLASPVPSAGK
jgi:hypothetical protein